MDLTNVDMNALAKQLRKPEGAEGVKVANVMASKNAEVIAFTLEVLGMEPRDRVLEIGFGPGEGIAQAVQAASEGFVDGIDYSPDMVTMAKERNQRALMEERTELICGEARALPYEDERFHKIFAVNVFHFWKDAMPELMECRRVLKSGGRTAFFMAYPSSWLPGLRESGVFIEREPEDVMKLLRDAGFQKVKSHTYSAEEFRGFAVIGEK